MAGVPGMCGVPMGAAQRLVEGGLIPGPVKLPLCVVRDKLVWSEPVPSSLVAMVMAVQSACSESEDIATCAS